MKYFPAILLICFLLFLSCNKPQPVWYPIPAETSAYFVQFQPGTCWVYEDTLHPGRYDTIELARKKSFSITPDGDVPSNDGFALYYKPGKTSDFSIFTQPNKNNSCGITICPGSFYGGSGLGEMEFSENNGTWLGANYSDSMKIKDTVYHNVLSIPQSCSKFSHMVFAKNIGLISYFSTGIPGQSYGIYVFVRTFKK